jgi:hypothetical protein
MIKKAFPSARGAALLLVLWAIAILSFAVLWVADLVNLELATKSAEARGMAARQIALSGVALGLHPQVTREDLALLNREVRPGEMMRVRIRGEGARFNINQLLAQQDRHTQRRRVGVFPQRDLAPPSRPLRFQYPFLLKQAQRGLHRLVIHSQFRRQGGFTGHQTAPAPPLELPAQIRRNLPGRGDHRKT